MAASRTVEKIYDENVVREAFRRSKVALLRRLPIHTLPSTLEGERIISGEEYSLITVSGSSSVRQRERLVDILLTKDDRVILKVLEILKTHECGYVDLVDKVFADMDEMQRERTTERMKVSLNAAGLGVEPAPEQMPVGSGAIPTTSALYGLSALNGDKMNKARREVRSATMLPSPQSSLMEYKEQARVLRERLDNTQKKMSHLETEIQQHHIREAFRQICLHPSEDEEADRRKYSSYRHEDLVEELLYMKSFVQKSEVVPNESKAVAQRESEKQSSAKHRKCEQKLNALKEEFVTIVKKKDEDIIWLMKENAEWIGQNEAFECALEEKCTSYRKLEMEVATLRKAAGLQDEQVNPVPVPQAFMSHSELGASTTDGRFSAKNAPKALPMRKVLSADLATELQQAVKLKAVTSKAVKHSQDKEGERHSEAASIAQHHKPTNSYKMANGVSEASVTLEATMKDAPSCEKCGRTFPWNQQQNRWKHECPWSTESSKKPEPANHKHKSQALSTKSTSDSTTIGRIAGTKAAVTDQEGIPRCETSVQTLQSFTQIRSKWEDKLEPSEATHSAGKLSQSATYNRKQSNAPVLGPTHAATFPRKSS